MIVTNELRRLAQEAMHPVTKGRWMRLFGERTVYDRMEDGCRGIPVVSTPVSPPHPFEAACLDFVAAANPATISELLDRLETAERERDAAELMSLALRAKVAEMEKRVPAALVKWQVGGLAVHIIGDVKAGDILYALPGAQTQGEEK